MLFRQANFVGLGSVRELFNYVIYLTMVIEIIFID